jgi:prepilin-type N-terminal cleavage/methylation domain-containing protein
MCEIRREGGFTIVEIMVVVAIMAILTAIAIPSYRLYSRRAKTSEALTHMSTIRALQVSYKAINDTYLELPAHPLLVPTDYEEWVSPGGNWALLDFEVRKTCRYQYKAEPGDTGDIKTSFKITAMTDFDGLGPPDDTWTMDQNRTVTHTNHYR